MANSKELTEQVMELHKKQTEESDQQKRLSASNSDEDTSD